MRNGKHTLISLVVVALAGLAIAIPAAQAAGQPQDSRPVYRGLGPAPSLSPDDRYFDRAIPVVSQTKIGGPDDRRFSRATPGVPTAPPATVSVQPRGFAWGDAMIGGSFGLALALLAAGAVAFALHHRRGVLRTA
jgi:hypothetical protein